MYLFKIYVLQLRGAIWAALRLDRNGSVTIWALPAGRLGGRDGLTHAIYRAYDQENNKGDDEKADNRIDEDTIIDRHRASVADE